jgi:predicted transcriptional regulator of viral defense system
MRISKYAKQLDQLLSKVVFKTSDARELGIPSRMLDYFCQQGIIERIGRGVYKGTDIDTGLDLSLEDLILTASSIPHGVICLISALCFYELTDQIMREYWIAVPNIDKSPKRPHTRIIRMRNISLGQKKVKFGSHEIRIFDQERTIVDSFRFLSHEIAIKALQAYLKSSQKPNLEKLANYAKALRVNITPYILALTT